MTRLFRLPRLEKRKQGPEERVIRWLVVLGAVALVLSSLERELSAGVSAVLRGIPLIAFGLLLTLETRHWVMGPRPWTRFRKRPLRCLMVAASWAALAFAGFSARLPFASTATFLFCLDLLGRAFQVMTEGGARREVSPARVVIMSFLLLIAAGTIALAGKGVASPEKGRLTLEEAFFTATSASCVTGLSVIDVDRDLSRQGQVVLLVLIQIGGLGLMTIGTFALILLDKTSRARGQGLVGDLLGTRRRGDVLRIAASILFVTFLIEAIGAVALGSCFGDLWTGVFCSISAFCNAGFFPGSDSLVPWAGHRGVNLIVMTLIVLGGLGFPVLMELARRGRRAVRERRGVRKRMTLTTRLVLWSSSILFVLGAAGWFLLERERSLSGMGTGEAILASSFQSVTLRTAGFSTVPMTLDGEGAISPATLVVMLGFMCIGASPLGTGGGLKTVTTVVLLLGVLAVIRGRRDISVMRRRIGSEVLLKATAVFVLYMLTLFGILLALLAIEGDTHSFAAMIFEVASALGTVGLSCGLTSELGSGGRLLICLAMFLGRVGPLTFFLLFSTARTSGITYPEEPIVVA